MMNRIRLIAIASAVGLLFSGAAAPETSLPPYVRDIATSLNASVESDGSVVVGGIRYIPILPPGYDPATMPPGTVNDMMAQPDGSVVFPGNLQMVPILVTPGEMPTLPSNFQPVVAGATMAPDFLPPNGFSPHPNMPLPPGVSVPPKPPAELVADMERAGIFPSGLVKFNADGTVEVNGTTFLPFVPPAAQQGLQSANGPKFMRGNSDGSVTLPDGSVFAPIVPGSNPGEQTLPTGFTPSADISLPTSVNLPPQFAIPPTVQIPPGTTLPPGVKVPDGYYLPPGTRLPPGVNLPTSVTRASDVQVPPGIMLPPGTTIDTANLPEGTTVLPNGAVVLPGAEIPPGVKPPSNWTPPSGVTPDGQGGYFVPPPPTNGYPPPAGPNSIKSDGSLVMQLPTGEQPPPDWVSNGDGTFTAPPPAFFGQVVAGGTIQAPTGGSAPPAGFTPKLPGGAATLTAFAPRGTLDSGGNVVNMPPPPAGFVRPTGWVENTDGTFQAPPPADFKAVTQNVDGSITIPAPPPGPTGSTPFQPPPGATRNADGTITFQAPTAMVGCQPPACVPPAGAPTGGIAPPPPPAGGNIRPGELPPPPPGFIQPSPPSGTHQPPPDGSQPPPPDGSGTTGGTPQACGAAPLPACPSGTGGTAPPPPPPDGGGTGGTAPPPPV